MCRTDSCLYFLENGKEGILTFFAPEAGYSQYDIKYDFFQSYAYMNNESIIENIEIISNLVRGEYSDKILIKIYNNSKYEVSSLSYLVKYYMNNKIVYIDGDTCYNIKSKDYTIETAFQPQERYTYKNIEYDDYEVSISTAYYD